MRVAAIGLAGAVILSSSAGGAEAATRGQCLPSAEMVQVLRAEGQRAVLTGQAVMVGAANLAAPLPVTYTSSADGSRGYELQTQRRSQGEVLCVTEVLSNVRLSDPAQRSFQAFRLPGGVSDQEARRIGRDEGIPNARGFNAMLEASAESGFFPVLQARIVGSAGHTLTAISSTRTNETMVDRADGRGISTLSYVMQRSGLTDYGRELLAR